MIYLSHASFTGFSLSDLFTPLNAIAPRYDTSRFLSSKIIIDLNKGNLFLKEINGFMLNVTDYCAFHKHANFEVQKPTDDCVFRCCQSS